MEKKHTYLECRGFIDGVNKALEAVINNPHPEARVEILQIETSLENL